MENYLLSEHHDLVTPDGKVSTIRRLSSERAEALVIIENISPAFVGYQIDLSSLFFNLKSALAQLGVNGIGKEYQLDPTTRSASVIVELSAIGELATTLLDFLSPGAYIGKLFAADERRRVYNPEYLLRMFGRFDRDGRPLLSLGGLQSSELLVLEKVEGRVVAYLPVQKGILTYEPTIMSFLSTFAKALHFPQYALRSLLHLYQKWNPESARIVETGKILIVRTLPLHIRTVFARVVGELLPQGFQHTTASVLQPDTMASGDIYELFGSSQKQLSDIPMEFYTLEPYREHVFFSDRDQLQNSLEDPSVFFKAFQSAPIPDELGAAVFIVKGDQLLNLRSTEWIVRETHSYELPGLIHPQRQALLVDRYIQSQSSYPFLKAIQDGIISSQGILLVRYFPSPLMKKMLLSDPVQQCLKRIYFEHPSLSHGDFFSHEDRSFLLDLAKFAIPVYWVDSTSQKLLQYVPKPNKDSGMFVPLSQVETFLKATSFGIYGSNLVAGHFEHELRLLLEGILEMRKELHHPLLNSDTPIALISGGGTGAMELGNRIAKTLNILSCANIVDFHSDRSVTTYEQRQNPFIDAKMTYRLDRLVERQAEFNLDFPIFLMGGIGTDFEYSLEQVRRKTGSNPSNPVLLFGTPDYWHQKITSCFTCNMETGTIRGSEWISNCFFCIQNASAGLKIYRQFFTNRLLIGPTGPIYPDGFVIV